MKKKYRDTPQLKITNNLKKMKRERSDAGCNLPPQARGFGSLGADQGPNPPPKGQHAPGPRNHAFPYDFYLRGYSAPQPTNPPRGLNFPSFDQNCAWATPRIELDLK